MARDREYHEGPDAARRFTDAMRRVIGVPKEELARRDGAQKQATPPVKKRRSKAAS